MINKGIVRTKVTKIFLSFALILCAFYAPAQTITLSLREEPIEKAFSSIEAQTSFRFIYSKETVRKARSVSVQLSNVSLKEALDKIFSGQPLIYSVEDDYIMIKAREEKAVREFYEIKGKVMNERGDGIGGASVRIKSSNEGVVTDEAGNFEIKTEKARPVLLVSSVGFEAQEIAVTDFLNVIVELKISVDKLDETVIIAYGKTTPRLNTGSTGKISSEQIEDQPVSNPLAAMQGRIPGLFITQQNGLPGSNFSVLIRGKNSILNGNDPLYIIDGVPFNSERLSQRDVLNVNNPLNVIDPASIESITVLKDADATAIYGSRGANGVILITTKKGKTGGTHLDVNYNSGWSRVTRMLDYMNTTQYLQMRREALVNDGVTPSISNAPDLLVWDTTRYTDWKQLLTGNTARTKNVNVRLSTGNAYTNFQFNGNYFKTTTVFPGSLGEDRASFSLFLNHRSTDNKFSCSFTIDNSYDWNHLSQTDLTRSINLPPNAPKIYDSLGGLNWREGNAAFANPFAVLLKEYNNKSMWIKNDMTLNYLVSKALSIKLNAGFNNQQLEETSINPIAAQDPATNPKGSAFFGIGSNINWILEPQAEYRMSLTKKMSMSALVGSSFQENRSYLSSMDASGYITDATIHSTVGATSIVSARTEKDYRYEGFFGRLHVDYDHSLIVNLTGRRDGSSRFGPGRRFSNFGAIGTAWIFSNTRFIRKELSFLSFGKLRASYGLTGNDRIDDYKYLDTWGGTNYPYQGSPAIKPTNLLNRNYAWERNKKLDLAIELGFFRDKILTTVEWFQNRSDNQLIAYTLPTQTGFSSILENFPGVVQNRGWEISVSSENIQRKNFSWKSSFNLTIPKNQLVAFPGLSSSSYAFTYVVGKSLNIIRGYQFLGVDPGTGIYRYLDGNKDGILNTLDYAVLGTKDPELLGGLENNLRLKSFRLSVLFQFIRQLGTQSIYGSGSFPGTRSNQPVQVLEHWQKTGDNFPYQKYAQQGATLAAASRLINSDAVLTDASFIRMKNVSVSYEVSQEMLKKLKLQSLRLFVEGQNLLTLTSYKGADPESQNLLQLPPLKQIAVGIHISL